jgi:hypothetical protein
MAIVFESFESVKVDGINAGSFSDCVANYASRRVELALACKSFHADLEEAHKTALDAANATIATRDATIAALETRVASLLAELPFNPKIIDATAFYNRITKDEFAMLSTSDDQQLGAIARAILAYKTNDWPVVFESPEMQGMLQYLVVVGFLTAERAAELTRDATREEAYDAS